MTLLNDYLRRRFGCKVYKLALNGGFTCPNRDGRIDTRGCIFCSEGGSGEFAGSSSLSIAEQIEEGKRRLSGKIKDGKYIAYFQAYTNTYAPPERLRQLYMQAIEHPDIVAVSVATRPDCLPDEVLAVLEEMNLIKPVWVELGLQTIHERTAKHINRGYDLTVFEDAYRRLKEAGITVIVHVILGLPGENKEDMLETVKYLAGLEPALDGIKLQNLQILKGTRMYEELLHDDIHNVDGDGQDVENSAEAHDSMIISAYHSMSMEEYTDLVAECVALLPEKCVVHRMTGDGPRKLLVDPLWSLDKKRVLNMLTKKTAGLFH